MNSLLTGFMTLFDSKIDSRAQLLLLSKMIGYTSIYFVSLSLFFYDVALSDW